MDRKSFLKKSLIAGLTSSVAPGTLADSKIKGQSTYDRMIRQVGFNHLPNKEQRTMKSILHKASTRGHANHGWLDSKHSFSFANYHNPERVHFGALRVLNDDRVAPSKGFGTHPHDNMEIISIPLSGDLEHKDSMGNTAVIKEGDIQAMSAGTGIFHSEYNKNSDKEVKFLQIWLFPNSRNVTPRYDQISLRDVEVKNKFYQVLSPNKDDQGVWIHQNAWFSMASFDQDASDTYEINQPDNGVYLFVLDGSVVVNGQELDTRDGYGIWDTASFDVKASTDAKLLLMEVPMAI